MHRPLHQPLRHGLNRLNGCATATQQQQRQPPQEEHKGVQAQEEPEDIMEAGAQEEEEEEDHPMVPQHLQGSRRVPGPQAIHGPPIVT